MISGTLSTQTDSLGHDDLRKALVTGALHLEENSHVLDRLNVFPVPDGDTGSNMVATFQAGIDAIAAVQTRTIQEISHQMTPALLKHSRGNSGFILARFFTGFFETASMYDQLHSVQISEGFANGSYQVTTSLFSPVEGTAITIIAAMTRSIEESHDLSPVESLRRALVTAREVLHRTPEMLPILARAGVVDSGALGFIILMEGVLAGITNETLPRETETPYRFEPRVGTSTGENAETGQAPFYRYCTEIVVSDFAGMSSGELKDYLTRRGDSIALVAENGLLKLHIHTNEPQELIDHLGRMGTVEKTKIEDMLEQMRLVAAESDGSDSCEILAVVPGTGFPQTFADIGITHTIVYGESLPSAGQIQDAVDAIPSNQVIILPNNRNILPAAMIVQDHSEKHVSILPTTDIIQGLTAAYGFSENNTTAQNISAMQECISLAESYFVYRATTTTRFHETDIHRGSYFIARDDEILSTGPDLPQTVLGALEASSVPVEERANISLYYSDAEGIDALEAAIADRYPALEIERYFGGQTRETVIISLE